MAKNGKIKEYSEYFKNYLTNDISIRCDLPVSKQVFRVLTIYKRARYNFHCLKYNNNFKGKIYLHFEFSLQIINYQTSSIYSLMGTINAP